MKTLLALILLVELSAHAVGSNPKHKREEGTPPPQKSGSATESGNEDDDEDGLRPEKDGVIRLKKKSYATAPLPSDNLPCQEKHSIESFVQMTSTHSPQGSALGGVYFISDLREVPQIFYLSKPGQWPEQISFFPDGVSYYALSPNGTKILAATSAGGDEQYQIYLIDPAKKKVEPLLLDASSRVESVGWYPKSDGFAYTSNARNKVDFDLYRFELKKGKGELLAELKGYNSVSDVSPDGNRIAITGYRSVTDSDVWTWDEKTKQVTKLSGKENFYRASGHFTADSKNLIYLSDEDRDHRQLMIADLNSLKSKSLYQDKWSVENIELDSSRAFLAFGLNQDGYSQLRGFELDPQGNKKRVLLTPTLNRKQANSVSFYKAAGKVGFFYARQSTTEISDIFLWSHPKDTRWTAAAKVADANCLSEEKLIRYPSFDGTQIPAYLFTPRGESLPTRFVVYAHGGPESQYRPNFSKVFQYLLERGYGILAPNIRGSMGYGREYTLMDNYKKREDSVKDILEGTKWLVSQRLGKTGKLSIYGGSYGGYVVLRAIEMEPELYAAASSSVGISNFVSFLKNTKAYRRALREIEYGPLSDEAFLKSISPLTYLEKIKTPLYLFHGQNDPRVPSSETDQMLAELKKRGVPVESTVFADEGHGNRRLRNIMEQARQMVYFFEKHTAVTP